MKAPHTPGPWLVQCPHSYIYAENPYEHGTMLVAQPRGWGHLTGRGGGCAMDEEKAIAIQEANARLIATAPDLLAFAVEAENWLDNHGDTENDPGAEMLLGMARAAIGKAGGFK